MECLFVRLCVCASWRCTLRWLPKGAHTQTVDLRRPPNPLIERGRSGGVGGLTYYKMYFIFIDWQNLYVFSCHISALCVHINGEGMAKRAKALGMGMGESPFKWVEVMCWQPRAPPYAYLTAGPGGVWDKSAAANRWWWLQRDEVVRLRYQLRCKACCSEWKMSWRNGQRNKLF